MTHLMFAEATTEPAVVGNWILAASIIGNVVMIVFVISWTVVTRNDKQKREVSFAGEPVDRKDFDKHVAEDKDEHNNLFAKLGGVERGVEARLMSRLDKISEEDRRSRRDMHEQLTKVGQEVAGLQTAADLTNQRIVQMDTKLDRMIEGKSHR